MNSNPSSDSASAGGTTSAPTATQSAGGGAARKPGNPRLGYYFAALNAIISGVAIYVNSLGVKTFADSTLYTALKNAVVGVCVLLPLIVLASSRDEFRRLKWRDWGLLLLVALIGGSVAYALNFRGLQISTAVTAALSDHLQFVFVAILAAIFLRERFGLAVWLGLIVLFIGLCFGISVKAVRLDTGVIYLLAATLLFAFDFIVIKYLLRTVSMLTVMIFKMSLGAALLLGYEAVVYQLRVASHHPKAVSFTTALSHLTLTQWAFVIVTGLILLAFTITSIAGLRHASATGVIAIGAGSPIITTLLVVLNQHKPLTTTTILGLALILAAVLVIFTFGRRRELRDAGAAPQGQLAMQKGAGA